MDIPHFAYPFICPGHLGCLHLHLVNELGVRISFGDPVFIYFGYIDRTGIAGLHSDSIFNCLKNLV
jgi:hypothetical protein